MRANRAQRLPQRRGNRGVGGERRGKRNWSGKAEVQASVEANQQRVESVRGRELGVLRTEKGERSVAHMHLTGGLRTVHLRGHANIPKGLLVRVYGVSSANSDRPNSGDSGRFG